ncbi:unnamed protein product [Cochlearia groenlandica]
MVMTRVRAFPGKNQSFSSQAPANLGNPPENLGNPPPPSNVENHMPVNPEAENGLDERFGPQALNSSSCIFKIPEFLTRDKDNSYDYHPTTISIGPYHNGKQQLHSLQETKKRFQDFFVSQTERHNVRIVQLVDAVKLKEQEIKDSYSENLSGFTDKELIDMMVLDGCFLLTLFLSAANKFTEAFQDPILRLPLVFSYIQRDLLLLENQIPLFVLHTLLQTANFPWTSGSPIPNRLNTIALNFFSNKFGNTENAEVVRGNPEAKHLLDLVRQTLIKRCGLGSAQAPSDNLKLISSAKSLRSKGIKFELRPKMVNMENMFLDISLNNNKLQIPAIALDDFISLLLLNCIAFEQFYADSTYHITSYAVFMGCLVNDEKDAAYLEEKGIIENYLGTKDEVCRFFKRITKDYGFDIDNSYLASVFVGVNEYTASGCHVRRAEFTANYCGTLWIRVSSCAAVTLLLLTLFQVIFAAGLIKPIS